MTTMQETRTLLVTDEMVTELLYSGTVHGRHEVAMVRQYGGELALRLLRVTYDVRPESSYAYARVLEEHGLSQGRFKALGAELFISELQTSARRHLERDELHLDSPLLRYIRVAPRINVNRLRDMLH